MGEFLENFLMELALFTFLGVLYYFYQKRRILRHEANKGPMIMGHLLEACLVDRGDEPEPELDAIIEAIDDYLHNRTASAPTALLQHYAAGPKCSAELKDVIEAGLAELE